MSNDLEIFNDILHLYLRPWKVIYLEQKFRELLHSLAKENYHHQPLYEVAFPKPLTGKTRYYRALIDNEAAGFLNNMEALITSASVTNEKKYHLHQALSKKLKDKLEGTEKVIVTHQFYFKIIEDHQHDKKVRDDAWIIQYVKYQLIQLYLEIQHQYAEYLNDDPVTEEDIHSLYFSEPVHSFIKPAPQLDLPKSAIQTPKEPRKIKFAPIQGDFKSEMKGILRYDQIISDPQLFARFEEEFFQIELIDHNYNFSDKHTEKQKLAAIYCVLMKKGYFKKRDFIKRKNIKDVDIRKFLDYRYNSNVDAQFRAWLRDPNKLAAYLKDLPWLNNLPLS